MIDVDRRAGPVDMESVARAAGRYVLTGQSEGLRIHHTGPTHSIDSVVAKEFPIEERLQPKKRRAQGKSTSSKRSSTKK